MRSLFAICVTDKIKLCNFVPLLYSCLFCSSAFAVLANTAAVVAVLANTAAVVAVLANTAAVVAVLANTAAVVAAVVELPQTPVEYLRSAIAVLGGRTS